MKKLIIVEENTLSAVASPGEFLGRWGRGQSIQDSASGSREANKKVKGKQRDDANEREILMWI